MIIGHWLCAQQSVYKNVNKSSLSSFLGGRRTLLREDTTHVKQTTGRYAAIKVLAFSYVASDNSRDVWRRIDIADGTRHKKFRS